MRARTCQTIARLTPVCLDIEVNVHSASLVVTSPLAIETTVAKSLATQISHDAGWHRTHTFAEIPTQAKRYRIRLYENLHH